MSEASKPTHSPDVYVCVYCGGADHPAECGHARREERPFWMSRLWRWVFPPWVDSRCPCCGVGTEFLPFWGHMPWCPTPAWPKLQRFRIRPW